MSKIILKAATVVNEGSIQTADILIDDQRIVQIGGQLDHAGAREIDCAGKYVIPGIIDDQVHFRQPGLTHKADILTESRAALAGGTTTFMEMPNTKPAALTQELLQDKYDIAAKTSYANYSFFMGAGNDNLEEVLKTDPKSVCGVKIFMGSSTGNMLVDNPVTLEGLFSEVSMLIATHCEDEDTIRANMAAYEEKYGDKLDASYHPIIRNVEGCYLSSSMAVDLAKKHDTRLHILHISTAKETHLFDNSKPLGEKRITSEACVHHLTFCDEDYKTKGNEIKCNPAIKTAADREEIWNALLDDRIDIVATDHAPHTRAEKDQHYTKAPSGLPLVQHSLYMMLDHYRNGRISLERVVEKMCHAPAKCFDIVDRGFIKEGYYADLVVIDPDASYTVDKTNILYKCGWSPLQGKTFKDRVLYTILNGEIAYDAGKGLLRQGIGQRISFDR